MIDKPFPSAIDAEQAILGTCLMNPNSILEIASILTPEMFYIESNRQLYIAILETAKKTGTSDIFSVCDYLRKKEQLENFGGVVGLTKRTENIISDAYLQNYVYLVREKFVLREYIRLGNEVSNLAFSEDLKDVIELAESKLFNISNFIQTKEAKKIDRCIDELLSEITKIYNKEKSLVGVPSGFTDIDRITGGWQPGNLIIIAGRPSMGKTALALTLIKNPAELKYPVVLFSLEMSESEITTRLLSGESGYTNIEIRNARIDLDKLSNDSNNIAVYPIYLDDTPALSLFDLRSKVKKLIVKTGIKLVVVDYLQLMKADAKSREQEVSQISRGLKAISKEFNIPVIAISQLNRAVEDRADRKPRLADLRESGAIEQDADIVCFIYRPAYYNISECTINGEKIDSKGLISFDCSKNRNGALFNIPLWHNQSVTRITDIRNDEDKQTSVDSANRF
jgi:replicative DNA helicase